MNRAHSADEAHRCIELALETGFTNLTVDLIYGSPTTSDGQWATNLQTVFDLGIPHVSSYCLTVESGTALFDFIKKQKTVAPEEEKSLRQFRYLMQQMRERGYDHYEISNFARPGFECRHNLRYWRNQDCLGLGVSAAGYDGARRKTNTDDLTAYMTSVETRGVSDHETVELSPAQRVGENLMLALRLKEGVVPTSRGLALYGEPLDRHVRGGLLVRDGARYRPTRTGWRLSNRLFVDLLGPE